MTCTQRLRRQRYLMWKKDPRCYWCGIRTIPPSWFETMKPDLRQKLRDKMATIDHLRPRHHPARGEPANGDVRRVLSCHKCNNDRDRIELSRLPREYFYNRGEGKPLSMKSLEELQHIEAILLAKRPRGRADREKVYQSLVAVRHAIRAKAKI